MRYAYMQENNHCISDLIINVSESRERGAKKQMTIPRKVKIAQEAKEGYVYCSKRNRGGVLLSTICGAHAGMNPINVVI